VGAINQTAAASGGEDPLWGWGFGLQTLSAAKTKPSMILEGWMRHLTLVTQPWRAKGEVPTDRQELGEEARRLLDNPVLHEAMDRVERKLIESWKNTAPGEDEQREAAYAMYWAMQQVRGELRVMIANATMAQRR
jgi:hypothetical protein